MDSKHQSKNKLWVQENKERYCLHVVEKSTENGNIVENGNIWGYRTQKNIMDNSTGCIRKQYAFHGTCLKERSVKHSK